jgi:hypothetical protein
VAAGLRDLLALQGVVPVSDVPPPIAGVVSWLKLSGVWVTSSRPIPVIPLIPRDGWGVGGGSGGGGGAGKGGDHGTDESFISFTPSDFNSYITRVLMVIVEVINGQK